MSTAIDTAAHTAGESRREDGGIRFVIPSLQLASVLCLLVAAAAVTADSGPWASGDHRFAAYLLFVAASATIGWIVRAMSSSRSARAVISLGLALLCSMVEMNGAGFATPVVLVAIALLAVDLSVMVAAAYWIGHLVLILALFLVATPGEPLDRLSSGLFNGGAIAVLHLIGLTLGVALVAYERRLGQLAQAVAERDGALRDLSASLTELESAHTELGRRAALDQELVLARERTRAARELHDGLGHRLTAVGMSLEFAQRIRSDDAERAWAEVRHAREIAQDALARMRVWVRALSPVDGDTATRGGVAALAEVAESFRGTGLAVDVQTADAEGMALDEERGLLLVRAVQEALTNAIRHANARHVTISVRRCRDGASAGLRTEVRNDAPETVGAVEEGPVRPVPNFGFGLTSLADRARALGGTLTAQWEDPDGPSGTAGAQFVLRLDLPLGPPDSATPEES